MMFHPNKSTVQTTEKTKNAVLTRGRNANAPAETALMADANPAMISSATAMMAGKRNIIAKAKRCRRVFTTTMGASQDMEFEATRRMIVNACYWAVGLEEKIPDKSDVVLVGEYKPTPFRFKASKDWMPGVTPAELFK